MSKKWEFIEINNNIWYSLYSRGGNMKNIRNKYILMAAVVILVGLAVAGGTYAWLSASLNVTNGNSSGQTHCFLIDYNIDNAGSGNGQSITGLLFPGSGPAKGLTGRVGLKVNSSCSLNGTGTLKLHINSGTSSVFGTVGEAHCENSTTLETLNDYKTSSACSGHGTWTSSTTPLKYAVYSNNAATGTPLSVGYITTSDIGNDKTIYNNISITSTQAYYYIFIWLDGYMTDNTFTDLSFDGYISASAVQA